MHFTFNGFARDDYEVRCNDPRLSVERLSVYADDISGSLVITGDARTGDKKIPAVFLDDSVGILLNLTVAYEGKTFEVLGIKFLNAAGEYVAKGLKGVW